MKTWSPWDRTRYSEPEHILPGGIKLHAPQRAAIYAKQPAHEVFAHMGRPGSRAVIHVLLCFT